jgi:DNA replication protein DnaC
MLALSPIHHHAPELLLTAKTQRRTPEETQRVLVELEIAARDESNCRHRLAAARFPVDKTLDEFNLADSSIPRASHDYLVTLDWIRRADNLCLVGPAGTGKTHYLIALRCAAVEAGHRSATSQRLSSSSSCGGPSPTTPSGEPSSRSAGTS